MQERLSLFLKLTAFFVFQFWLMIVNHYSLRGSLLGLPATAVVGSSAIVLLAFLIFKVRQPVLLPLGESASPWGTRFALVSLIVGFWLIGSGAVRLPLGIFVMLVLCLWIFVGFISLFSVVLLKIWLLISGSQISSATEKADVSQINLVIGTLIGLILSCIAVVLFFYIVVALVSQAALPKPIAVVTYILQMIGLVLILAFFLGQLQESRLGDRLLCSTSYPSPSGQRSIVIEDYEEWEGDRFYSHAYLNGLIFRKDLGDFPNNYGCKRGNLMFNWSTDEHQVDWEKLFP